MVSINKIFRDISGKIDNSRRVCCTHSLHGIGYALLLSADDFTAMRRMEAVSLNYTDIIERVEEKKKKKRMEFTESIYIGVRSSKI